MDNLTINQKERLKVWNDRFEHNNFPINLVAIETQGGCTRRCSFCPVSKTPPRHGKLTFQIIESVFKQLRSLNYSGQLRLHYYNEPLLDKRLLDIIYLLRRYLPENFFRLTTNGDLLSLEKIYNLIEAGTSEIKISIYEQATYEKIKRLLEPVYKKEIKKKIKPTKFYETRDIINRGGTINASDVRNLYNVKPGASLDGCSRLEFNIDYKGNVFPCCHSFDGSYFLGNIYEESLLEIYHNNKHRFKDHFTANFTMEVCRKCVGLL